MAVVVCEGGSCDNKIRYPMKFTFQFLHDATLPPVSIEEEVVHIGTAPGNHISFDRGRHPMVSRAHAQILADESGTVWLYDNDSRSGIYVDGQQVEDRKELVEGVQITFGKKGPTLQVSFQPGGSRVLTRKRVGQTAIIRLVRDEMSRRQAALGPLRGITGAVKRVVTDGSPEFKRNASVLLVLIASCLAVVWYRVGVGEGEQRQTRELLDANVEETRSRLLSNQKVLEETRHRLQANGVDLQETRQRLVKNQEALQETRRQLEDTRSREVETRQELARYEGLHDEFSREIGRRKKLEHELAQLRTGMGDPFAGVAHAYRDGVYLIAVRFPNGQLQGLGTAFLIREDGVLATNAHVVLGIRELIERFSRRGVQVQPILIMNREPAKRFRILQMKVHPEYTKKRSQSVDTAVMKIDTVGERLGPVLRLASSKVLRNLRSGQPIALLGFPGEENNPHKPIATFKHGHISRVTTLQKAAGSYLDEILVQHSVSITPGTSGSPILDDQGRVVAIQSSGLAITIRPLGIRFMSPARINWAIRGDKIQELLEEF